MGLPRRALVDHGQARAQLPGGAGHVALERNADDEPDEHERGDHGRAAVADERHGLARHGRHADDAERVDDELHHEDHAARGGDEPACVKNCPNHALVWAEAGGEQ